jgi:non-ribosomal peptide synthetase component F
MKLNQTLLAGEEHDHPQDTVISKLFEQMLDKKPELLHQTALLHTETKIPITFKKLNEDANRLARVLLRKIKQDELKPNQDGDYVVAIRFVPDEGLVITLLAIFKAGLAYVPLAPNWPEGRLQHILGEAEPIMIITNTNADILYKAYKSPSLSARRKDIVFYEELIKEAVSTEISVLNLADNMILNHPLKGNRLFAVLYTSGSTGSPKGVRHLHRAALNRFFWQWRVFPYESDEVCVFKTTITFVDSVTEIWSPLLCGKQVIIFPTKVTQNVEEFVEHLDKYKIGRVFVVTSMVRNILSIVNLKKMSNKLASVKYWDCSAETVTKDILVSFFEYFSQGGHIISNFYGSTEMMDVTYETFRSIQDVYDLEKEGKIPIGSPIDNMKAYLLNDNLEPVAEGCIGALYISGRNLCDGYVGARKGNFTVNKFTLKGKTEDKHTESLFGQIGNNFGILYQTGDYAVCYNGRLYYEGRMDSQVKVRGHRVDLLEIEKSVYLQKGITKVTVLCYSQGNPNQRILCFYSVQDGKTIPEAMLEVKLASILPDYSMPRFIRLSSFPLLANGKIDRQQLLKKYEASLACSNFTFSDDDFKAHVHEELYPKAKVLLESISVIIPDATRKPRLDDKYFNIGGDSINMVMVIQKIKDHGYNISVTDFVNSCNLADIVKSLSSDQLEAGLTLSNCRLEQQSEYTSRTLIEEDKEVVIDMISRSFSEKGDLTTLADVTYDVITDQLEALWKSLLSEKLSIVLCNKTGQPVGACLNFDARSKEAEPLCARSAFARSLPNDRNKLVLKQQEVPMSVVEFLNEIEAPFKDRLLPKEKGKFIYTSMLGTAQGLR